MTDLQITLADLLTPRGFIPICRFCSFENVRARSRAVRFQFEAMALHAAANGDQDRAAALWQAAGNPSA